MSRKGKVENFEFRDLFAEENSCAQEIELYRYHQQLLGDDARKSFETHLKNCTICAQQLFALQTAEDTAQSTSLDPEQAHRIFERTHAKLREHLDTKYPEKKGSIPFWENWIRVFQFPAYANAFLLLVIALLIYPAYRGFILNQETNRLQQQLAAQSQQKPAENTQAWKEQYDKQIAELNQEKQAFLQPQISDSELHSVRTERSGEIERIRITFDETKKTSNLVFALPPSDFESYSVRILKNDLTVWQKNEARFAPNALISLQLHSQYLKDGEYLLQIDGKKGNDVQTLAQYKLQITGTGQ